jgi:hypothetical protein
MGRAYGTRGRFVLIFVAAMIQRFAEGPAHFGRDFLSPTKQAGWTHAKPA